MTAGNWDVPPAYHGNPWAPGGVGHAAQFVYEPLFVHLPRSARFVPRLGERFEESDGGRTLTVHLHPGAQWHDGTPVSAEDVRTTFQVGYLRGVDLWRHAERIDCPTPHTVVFHFKVVSPLNKVRALTELITSPRHLYADLADRAFSDTEKARNDLMRYRPSMPIGTGPFRLTRVTPSDMTLERFESHYMRPNVDFHKVRIQRWGSNEVVWSYLMANQVDAVSPSCPADVAQEILHRNPSMQLITPPDYSDFGFVFNCTKWDRSSRTRIARMLNRDMLRQVACTYGRTESEYSLGIPYELRETWLGPTDSLTRYTFDPQLTFDASLEILAPAGATDLVLLAEAASSQLNRRGMRTEVRVLPEELYVRWLEQQRFDMAAVFGAQLTKFGHPCIAYGRLLGQDGQLRKAAGIPAVAAVNELELGSPSLVPPMAHLLNEELPYLACFEKRLMVFVSNSRIRGWPAVSDPLWEGTTTSIELMYATMMTQGILRAVR